MNLKLEVFSSGQSFDNIPDIAVVEISEDLQKRIIELSHAAQKLDVDTIREMEDSPSFHNEEGQLDCPMDYVWLNVSQRCFFWSGRPKHSEIEVETEFIKVDEL